MRVQLLDIIVIKGKVDLGIKLLEDKVNGKMEGKTA